MRLYDKQGSELFRDISRFFALIKAGDVNMVRDLLRQGLPVNRFRPYYPLSGVLVACISGQVRVLRVLVDEFGAEVDEPQTEERVTPLHWMAKQERKELEHIQSISLLIEKGADVNAVDASGCSALHRVVDLPTLTLLLAHRANILQVDKYGNYAHTCSRTKNRSPTVISALSQTIARERLFQRRKLLLYIRQRETRLTLT